MSKDNAGIDSYPLYWPQGWKRTSTYNRCTSKFRSTFAVARDELFVEIARLQGRYSRSPDPVLSTNVALRLDGLPYANQKEPDDPGVAVYFQYKKKPMVFACDKYKKVWENFVAIKKTVEAIRGIERWGASDMMERAFQGFVALPASSNEWWDVLGVDKDAERPQVEKAFHKERSRHHPDLGGSSDRFNAVMDAWQTYLNSTN